MKLFVAYTDWNNPDSGCTPPLYTGTDLQKAKYALWIGEYGDDTQEEVWIYGGGQVDYISVWENEKCIGYHVLDTRDFYELLQNENEFTFDEYLELWNSYGKYVEKWS